MWGPRLQNHRLSKAKPKLAEIKCVQNKCGKPNDKPSLTIDGWYKPFPNDRWHMVALGSPH